MESLRGIAYKSVRYFHFEPRGDGDAPQNYTQSSDSAALFCGSAYKFVSYFHFEYRGDGDALEVVRKSEIQ